MAARSGKAGTLQVGSNQAEILRWTLDMEAEVSKYGAGGFKYGVAGVIDVKGSFETVSLPTGATVGATVTLSLAEGGTGGKTYSGEAIIKKVSVTVVPDTGEIIKYSIDFEGSGEWTIA
ncbi:hypothetical protein [Thermogutta sp.]|uniref:hypothetical protein n=1 Tax=Thermogutta sp. TaxID=1962930 RepID=UPI00321F7A98